MNTRYEELKKIAERFPFLKDRIASNIREVYSEEEILNYNEFIKEYDYDTDLFGLCKREPSFTRGYYSYSSDDNTIPLSNRAAKLLYTLISFTGYNSNKGTADIFDNNYEKLIETCNILITDLAINESECESKHFSSYRTEDFTENDKKLSQKIKGISYIASFYAFNESFVKYIRSVDPATGKSNFILDLLNETNTIKEFNRLCSRLDLESRGKYFNYQIDNKTKAFNMINSAVAKVYDTYTLEDIEKFKEKAAKYGDIFKYFHIDITREASILNSHISDEERAALTKDFTSADDIAKLVKNVMSAFSASNYFESDKVNSIISNIIVNNKKIRDRDFPTTKNKVVHEFFRLMFINNSTSRNFTDDTRYMNDVRTVINSNKEYTLDPYFITSLLMKDSVVNDEYRDNVKSTKKFIAHVFSSAENVLEFINMYIAELSKPEKDRVSTVKGTKANILSYGNLYYIVSRYTDGIDLSKFTGIEADGTINVIKLLLMAFGENRTEIRKRLLEATGAKRSSSGYGYYGDSDNQESISRIIDYILQKDRGYGANVVGNDGKIHSVSRLDTIYHGKFNHIMSYLTEDDDDFDYNENFSVGVRECSRYSYRDTDKEIVPKDYYRYNREAVKLILIELYRCIVEKYGENLTSEQLETIKNFITRKDDTITILPDTSFATIAQSGNKNNKNALFTDYASDVTDYGCLNYISITALGIYLVVMRDNKNAGNLFKFNLTEDLVLLPELDVKYYDSISRKTFSDRSKATMDTFNSMTKEEYEFFKPLFIDNFADNFAFTRTMQVCVFANMLNMQDRATYSYESYSNYLVDSYSLQSDVAKPASSRPIDYIQVFFINVIYPALVTMGLITSEQIHEVEDSFNKAYTDYECLLSLR